MEPHPQRTLAFLLALFLAAGAIVLPVSALNLIVDPFGRIGTNWMGVFVYNERITKPPLYAAGNYSTLLIGSSKVASISPKNDLHRTDVFNASFGAALPEEMRDFLITFARPGQTVLMGLDLYMFNERQFPWQDRTAFTGDADPLLTHVLSLSVAEQSIRSIGAYRSRAFQEVLADGTRNQGPDWRKHNALTGPDYRAVLNTLREKNYHNFRFSMRRVNALRTLKSAMIARNARLIAFLNPLNCDVRDLIRELAEADFQSFKREMRAIFPDLRDFTGPEWSGREMYFRHDPYHYLPTIGARMVQQIIPPPTPR